MWTTVRPYALAGAALGASSLIAIASITPALDAAVSRLPGVSGIAVRLLADGDSLLNIPVNLLIDIANIPYALYEAPYSVDGLVPQFADQPGGGYPGLGLLPNGNINFPHGAQLSDYPDYLGPVTAHGDFPDAANGTFDGALNNLAAALDYTGSWWESSPTNIWGWDTANPWNFTALINTLVPIPALSKPLADNLNAILTAEFPVASVDNNFLLHDLLGELESVFRVPLSELQAGYTYPLNENSVGLGADPLGNGGTLYPEIWSGQTVHVDPNTPTEDYLQHLMENPADNPIHPGTSIGQIISTFWNVYNAEIVDFNAYSPGTDSFVFQGAKVVYGVPALINGIVNGPHGLCPGCPDVIPQSFTNTVGGALNESFGPDSAYASSLIAANNEVQGLIAQIEDLTRGLFPVDAADVGAVFDPSWFTDVLSSL